MDVLHRLFSKAAQDGVLKKMAPSEIKFQCSIYADDAILFIRPSIQEARAVKEILSIFGQTTGLHTNLAKCSVTTIYGGEDVLPEIVSILGCQVQTFPIKYLGLPLSRSEEHTSELQSH